jgi:glycosyltransferase involved in cell wall biosynthesis
VGPELPTFSVIIPTYGRPRQLAACLQGLTRLDYPRARFEVIVVDDGSAPPLAGMIDGFRDCLPVCALAQPNAGPAAARNTGAAHARGEFLAFLDDDCQPAAGWLRALAARFRDTPDHLIGGRTCNALPDDPYATASQLIIDYLYAVWNATPGQAHFFASNNLAVPAELFHRLDGFDPAFTRAAGEDRELCDRWLGHGYRTTYAPEAVIYHAHALNLYSFWRQHMGYGRGSYCFFQTTAHLKWPRLRWERLAFHLGLLRYPLACLTGRRALAITALVALSQAAVAAGFVAERSRPRNRRPRQWSAAPAAPRGGMGLTR